MKEWEQFLKQQEVELGTETIKKWLRSLKIKRFDACNLYLEAKDSFQALWFEEHIRDKAVQHLLNGNNKLIKVHLAIAESPPLPVSKKNRFDRHSKEVKNPFPFNLTFDELNPFYQFNNYLVTEENFLTYKFLSETAEQSKEGAHSKDTFNPIYFYGPKGCGKTHLLMSLAQAFIAKGLKTIYARAELFTDHVVTAIRAGEMSIFRQAYRNADILLVDDVHVFSRKGATQEEFFHTFNTLHLEGKQIILTANCSPQELHLVEPRLVSRFEWGIVLPLKLPETHDLRKILEKKEQAFQVQIPARISDFLVETFTSNPKALVKAFEALILRLHIDSDHSIQNLSISSVKSLLSDLLMEESKSALTSTKIIEAVAQHYGIRIEDIVGKSQTRECVLPRQLAMHVCREKLKMPFMKIGDLFSRDHSTVMSSVKFIQTSLEQDHRDIGSAWHAILKKLQA